jgi:hypothetical protein
MENRVSSMFSSVKFEVEEDIITDLAMDSEKYA